MKKSELKQLIKEQISLMGYTDQKAIEQPISSSDINSLMKIKTVKEQVLSKSYIKEQLSKILNTCDDFDKHNIIEIKVICNNARTNWIPISKDQFEAIVRIFK